MANFSNFFRSGRPMSNLQVIHEHLTLFHDAKGHGKKGQAGGNPLSGLVNMIGNALKMPKGSEDARLVCRKRLCVRKRERERKKERGRQRGGERKRRGKGGKREKGRERKGEREKERKKEQPWLFASHATQNITPDRKSVVLFQKSFSTFS